MPKKCVKPARGVRSLPQVGSCDGGHKDSQSSSSSSSVSTRSSLSTIKQFKKAQLAEKKAVKKASRLGGEPTKQVPPHLVSHMLPYFYPNDCEDDPVENDGGTEVPPHLVSHVTPYCYPVHGTADSEDGPSPEPEVPRHLTPHVTTYCYPVTGTADDEDTHSPRPDVVPPHLESHITHYGQPTDNDGDLIEWPTDGRDEDGTRSMSGKRQLPTYNRRHLESHLFDSDNVHDNGRAELRTSICCEMTRDHANMRDSLFGEADTPAVRRIDRRRPVANCCNLFEESKPKPRPLSITIVARAQEDTKANIFGSESQKSCSRRRWENDTKKTIFGCEADAKTTPADSPSGAHGSRYEDTKEKLFGETYGIKEAQEEYDRRQRTVREDTKMTLFGPPVPSSPRPQSARSFMTTHNNLFGEPPPPQHGRRALLRENTFDNLFGMTQQRGITQGDTERYTTKNPKILKVSSSSVKQVCWWLWLLHTFYRRRRR